MNRFALIVWLGAALAAYGQRRPHHRTGTPFPLESAAAGQRLPFETPPSLACVYSLVADRVPGCPVIGTHALPDGGSGLLVIVNAYDYPTAAGHLNAFSRHFGVPECNSDNPCFRKVYATGAVPPVDSLWAGNASQSIEYAHAFAPRATIVLLEAASATAADLNFAVTIANRLIQNSPTGKGQVVMPFGDFETPGELSQDALFTTPGVVYISGNEGSLNSFEYPAASPNVIALGGTGLIRDAQGNFVAEIASTFWSGGKSLFEPRPAYQDSVQDAVGGSRGIPDVAFAADPVRGACAYYNTTPDVGQLGWNFTGNVGFGEVI